MRIRTALLFSAALGVGACGGDSGPTDGGGNPSGDIVVDDNFFSPSSFNATAGDQVVWAWAGQATHNVTFDDGPASPSQSSGTYSRTFSAAGTYPYHCTIHGAAVMSGTVVVAAQGNGGPGGGGGGGNGGGGGYGGVN